MRETFTLYQMDFFYGVIWGKFVVVLAFDNLRKKRSPRFDHFFEMSFTKEWDGRIIIDLFYNPE